MIDIRKTGLLLIGLLTIQFTFSQENYLPGYVINANSDTLIGFIDYRNWDFNPDKIQFKTNTEDEAVSYKPSDIIEFRVDDEWYVSGIVQTEVSPFALDKVTDDPKLYFEVDTTFLQTLIKGNKSLYFYKKTNGRDNFYIKQDTGFELLVYKRYIKEADIQNAFDKGRFLNENRRYLGQLSLYLNDCASIQTKLAKTSYKQGELVNLFKYYNQCSSSETVFKREASKIHPEFGILAGLSITSIKFISDDFDYLVHASYKPSINVSAGLFLDLVIPRNQGKWSINNELFYSTYSVEGSFNEYVNENKYTLTTTGFGYTYLKFNNLVRFKYPIGRMFIYCNAGISNGFALTETNYKKKEIKLYDTNRLVEELAIEVTRKHEQGFIFGTGVKYDQFSCELRYEKSTGMSKYINLRSLTSRFHFILGYRF